jgi:hypothetical protein
MALNRAFRGLSFTSFSAVLPGRPPRVSMAATEQPLAKDALVSINSTQDATGVSRAGLSLDMVWRGVEARLMGLRSGGGVRPAPTGWGGDAWDSAERGGRKASRTAITVQVVNGMTSLAELQDQPEPLIRLFFIQARDLNEAIQVAARMPQARMGVIEVRRATPG